jgi:hypothetical protein
VRIAATAAAAAGVASDDDAGRADVFELQTIASEQRHQIGDDEGNNSDGCSLPAGEILRGAVEKKAAAPGDVAAGG